MTLVAGPNNPNLSQQKRSAREGVSHSNQVPSGYRAKGVSHEIGSQIARFRSLGTTPISGKTLSE